MRYIKCITVTVFCAFVVIKGLFQPGCLSNINNDGPAVSMKEVGISLNSTSDSVNNVSSKPCHANPPLPPVVSRARCALVANGPSLNRMPPGWGGNLRRKCDLVMGMNKIYLGIERFNLTLDLYAAINPLVVQQSVAEIQELDGFKFVRAREAKLFPCGLKDTFFLSSSSHVPFSKNLHKGVNEGWTVTYVSLQVLYVLGCVEVIIVGMDHSFDQKGDPNQLQNMTGRDPNHFDPNYFGGGQHWHLADLSRSEKHYRIARKTYEADGRRILDATPGGKCDIFEKVSFDQI